MEKTQKQYREHSAFEKNNLRKWLFPKGYYLHFYKSFDMTFHSHMYTYPEKEKIAVVNRYLNGEKISQISQSTKISRTTI